MRHHCGKFFGVVVQRKVGSLLADFGVDGGCLRHIKDVGVLIRLVWALIDNGQLPIVHHDDSVNGMRTIGKTLMSGIRGNAVEGLWGTQAFRIQMRHDFGVIAYFSQDFIEVGGKAWVCAFSARLGRSEWGIGL